MQLSDEPQKAAAADKGKGRGRGKAAKAVAESAGDAQHVGPQLPPQRLTAALMTERLRLASEARVMWRCGLHPSVAPVLAQVEPDDDAECESGPNGLLMAFAKGGTVKALFE